MKKSNTQTKPQTQKTPGGFGHRRIGGVGLPVLALLLLVASCANPVAAPTPVESKLAVTALPALSTVTDPVTGNNRVSLSCSDSTADLYYTIGSTSPADPVPGSVSKYTGPLTVLEGTVHLKVVAKAQGKEASGVVSTSITTTAVRNTTLTATSVPSASVVALGSNALGNSFVDPASGLSVDLVTDAGSDLDLTKTDAFLAHYPSGNAVVLRNTHDGALYYTYQPAAATNSSSRGAISESARVVFNIGKEALKKYLGSESRAEFEVSYKTSTAVASETFEAPFGAVADYLVDRATKTNFLVSAASVVASVVSPTAGVATGFLSNLVINKQTLYLKVLASLPAGFDSTSLNDATPVRLVLKKITPDSFCYTSNNLVNKVVSGLDRVTYFFDKFFVPGTSEVASYEIQLLTSPKLTALGSADGLTGPDAQGNWTYDLTGHNGDLILTPVMNDPVYRVGWGSVYYSSGSTIRIHQSEMQVPFQVLALRLVPVVEGQAVTAYQQVVSINLLRPTSSDPTPIPSVATPVFSPVQGMFTSPVSVTLSRQDATCQLWYTRDGSAPVAGSSAEYTGTPIAVDAGTVLKALQTKVGSTNSSVTSATYRIFRVKSAPASAETGSTLAVTVADATPFSTIILLVKAGGAEKTRLTTIADATGLATFSVVTSATWGTGAFTLSALDGVQVLATLPFSINLTAPKPIVPAFVAAPEFSVASGSFSQSFTLTLTSVTPGASIVYTTDGVTEPSLTTGAVYTAPLTISTTTTVKAVAYVQTVLSTRVQASYLRTPSAPVFTVTAPTATGATFSWGSVTGATKYRVFVSTSPIPTTSPSNGLETGLTTFVYTGGQSSTSYHVTVSAVGPGGETLAPEQTFTTSAPAAPQFLLRDASNQAILTQGSTRNLGNLSSPGESAVADFTLTNGGSGVLTLTGSPQVSFSGANAADFRLVAAISAPIGSGSFTKFSIAFQPSTPGSKTATVTIPNNDPLGPTFSFQLSATVGVGTPATFSASKDRYIAVYLEWSEVTGATGFELQRSSSSTFANPTSLLVGFTHNYYDQAVTTPSTWYYRVRALVGSQTGNWSSVVTGVRQPIIGSTPGLAQVGTLVTQSGSGYTPNGDIVLFAYGPDGQLAGGKTIAIKADGQGNFATQFTVQASKLKGYWTLYAQDSATGVNSFVTGYTVQ